MNCLDVSYRQIVPAIENFRRTAFTAQDFGEVLLSEAVLFRVKPDRLDLIGGPIGHRVVSSSET